jgi:AraC family transcriptional regulator, regulatory protein of adaptative response / methylated-DNA-[protein]-cysteine methyltransferase
MASGVGSHMLFNTDGTSELHLATASYEAGGRGARISYTIAVSPFGHILIARTDFGACWIGIHRSADRLEAELRSDLPNATIARDDAGIADLANRVIAYVNGKPDAGKLPIDIRATPFQLSVWQELCAIPFGATRSYGEIARRLRRPNAARAVGHANGSNPLALLIPCHRAVGSDGSLTGYRWGVEYKRLLLDHERSWVEKLTSSNSRPVTTI